MSTKSVVLLLSVSLVAIGLQPANLIAADGEVLYNSKCSSCHGTDGKGKKNIADMFKVDISKLNLVSEEISKKSDTELAKIIHDGAGKYMKPFKDKLSDEEISAVVKYIRSSKK